MVGTCHTASALIFHCTELTTLACVIQYLEVIYLFYRRYFWLPGLLAAATAAAAISLLLVVRQQSMKMTALVNQARLTPIVKAGWVRATSSHNLVPGDVIVLQKGKAMCDMVILQGSCLVVESMLSGEVGLNWPTVLCMLRMLCSAAKYSLGAPPWCSLLRVLCYAVRAMPFCALLSCYAATGQL